MRRIALTAVVLMAVACGGRDIRLERQGGPRLTSERLGDVRSSLTYDGDWMGGAPSEDELLDALDLARRRGVELLVDLRGPSARDAMGLDAFADERGMDLVVVDLALPSPSMQELPFEISNAAVDRVRGLLRDPERANALLLDDDGTLAASVYAIYLATDVGAHEGETLRAARASGMTDDDVAFVRQQVDRIRG